MDWEEVAEKAYRGEPLPEHAPLLALGYYTALRQIYKDFIDGKLSRDEGARRKEVIRQKLDDEASSSEQRAKAYAYYQDAIRVCGILRSEINKSNDLKEVADKALQCVALVTGDAYFYDHNAKRLGLI